MRVSYRKVLIVFLTFVIVYQDSITKLFKVPYFDYFDELLILFFVSRTVYNTLGKKNVAQHNLVILLLISIFWFVGTMGCILNSSLNNSSLIMAGILMIKFFLLIISISVVPFKAGNDKFFIQGLRLVGCVSAFAGIINFCVPKLWAELVPYAYEYSRFGFPSVMGLFIHAGQYGWFMLLVGLTYYVEYRMVKKKKTMVKFLAYVVLACLSMKAKVIIGIVWIMLYDYLYIQRKKLDLKKMIYPIIAVLLSALVFKDLIVSTYYMYFTNSGGSARYALLQGGLLILKDFFPIGVGFGKYGTMYAKLYYSEWYYAYGLYKVYGLQPGRVFFGMDTFWPAIMGETGVCGTLIYISLLTFIYRTLIKVYNMKSTKSESRILFISMFSIFVFMQAVIESFGEPIFNSSPQNIIIGIVIGLSLSLYTRRGVKND